MFYWPEACRHQGKFGMNYTTIWSMLTQTFAEWNEHEAPRWGAALAFYTILSLAPLVILALAIVLTASRPFVSLWPAQTQGVGFWGQPSLFVCAAYCRARRYGATPLQPVESERGAVAVGRACLFPPLSSGGASVARP